MPELTADVIPDFSLRAHNTFGFDVRARLARPLASPAQLRAALADSRMAGLPRLILGGGSNVVLTGDFEGVVYLVALRGRRLLADTGEAWLIEAAAGENWHEFVVWTLQNGWPGLENLALIPGTVGAAPIQNIGAYGLEMAERFERLSAIELATGQSVEFDAAACRFGYRDSFFKDAGRARFMITSVTFRLPKIWCASYGYADLARELAEQGIAEPGPTDIFNAVVAVRRAKLPDPAAVGNAGSFFKNPVISATGHAALQAREPGLVAYPQPDGQVKLAAGWLIDQCGWKGQTRGRAAVHERQALVLINRGGASGAEVLALAGAIQDDVARRFGVRLETEPVIV